MKVKTLTLSTLGIAGLVTTGLLAFTTSTSYAGDEAVKRDDDASEIVLADDDDDDGDDTGVTDADTDTDESDINTNTVTNTAGDTDSNDGTGANDDSRSNVTKDWTKDGPGDTATRDTSANHTNDKSRHNTRG